MILLNSYNELLCLLYIVLISIKSNLDQSLFKILKIIMNDCLYCRSQCLPFSKHLGLIFCSHMPQYIEIRKTF